MLWPNQIWVPAKLTFLFGCRGVLNYRTTEALWLTQKKAAVGKKERLMHESLVYWLKSYFSVYQLPLDSILVRQFSPCSQWMVILCRAKELEVVFLSVCKLWVGPLVKKEVKFKNSHASQYWVLALLLSNSITHFAQHCKNISCSNFWEYFTRILLHRTEILFGEGKALLPEKDPV